MNEENRPINPDEKLTASTSMTVRNDSDIPCSVENWTCGFVFLIDTVNLEVGTEGSVKAEYVWYDFRAKNMKNEVIAELKGAYYNKTIILSGRNGNYTLSSK